MRKKLPWQNFSEIGQLVQKLWEKVSYQRLGTGTEYPDPEPGNRDLITVELGNSKSGYLTTLIAGKYFLKWFF